MNETENDQNFCSVDMKEYMHDYEDYNLFSVCEVTNNITFAQDYHNSPLGKPDKTT